VEAIISYIPIGSLFLFVVTSIVAVKVGLTKRPTFKDTEKRYRKIEVCDETVQEKLNCIPDIKKTVTQIETKIDIFLSKNGGK